MNDKDRRVIPFPDPSRRPAKALPSARDPKRIGAAPRPEQRFLPGPVAYSVSATLPPPTGRFPTPAELIRLIREAMEGREPDPEAEHFLHSNEVLLDWLYGAAQAWEIRTAEGLARAMALPADYIVLLQEGRLLVRDMNHQTARALAAFLGLPCLVVQVAAGLVELRDLCAIRRRAQPTD